MPKQQDCVRPVDSGWSVSVEKRTDERGERSNDVGLAV